MGEQTTGPDLSRLSLAERRRVALAVIAGATWVRFGTGQWMLFSNAAAAAYAQSPVAYGRSPEPAPPGYEMHVYIHPDPQERISIYASLPDPENDSAAAWELMVRERIVMTTMRDGSWLVAWDHEEPHAQILDAVAEHSGAVIGSNPATALVDAVLAKHGHQDLIG